MPLFDKLIVLELASVLAGPSVGQFFAELGATVIKIENPHLGGDVTRTWRLATEAPDSLSAYFASANFGKKSLAIDLQKPDGQAIIYQLVQKADVVIASYKAGDAEKLGVDYPTLASLNSQLIYGHITGYQDSRVGYDAVIQAEAGFMLMNGEPNGQPVKMPVALIDLLAAHQLKEGLLLALLKKNYSQSGSYVKVSLFDSAISSLANQATNWLTAGHIAKRLGSEHPNIVPYGNVFRTQDQELILVAIGNDRQFSDLCKILEIKDLAQDLRFRTNYDRVQNRNILIPMLAEQFAQFEQSYLLEQFEKKQVPAGSLNNMQQVFALPEAQRLVLENEKMPSVRGLRLFVGNLSDEKWETLNPPPHLGEHNEEILQQLLGLSPAEINELYTQQIIGR